MRSRRAATTPIVLALMIGAGLAGCSSSQAYSGMAQETSSAASSIRSVAISLTLETHGRVLSSITDTSVQDAVTKLVEADGTLTAMDVTGGEREARDRSLREVRAAESALLSIQAGLSTTRASAIHRSSTLIALAKKLNALSKSLESR